MNPLSSSSLYEILRACAATKRTSLRGIDNIATDGASAFDTPQPGHPETSILCNNVYFYLIINSLNYI